MATDRSCAHTLGLAHRPAKPAAGTKPTAAGTTPRRGIKPDDSKLISALATGQTLDESAVKAAFATIDAAHQADHAAREDARYAAIAKQLGLSSDAVKAAFEANRPAKQGPPQVP